MASFNPFARRETHSPGSVLAYKILAIISWLVVVVASVYYNFHAPHDDRKRWRSTIWGHNTPTPFALNPTITSIYWIVLFILQIGYVWHLFSGTPAYVTAASSVGSHFILNNLLQFAFVMLFVRGHFIVAEIILVLNFFNLTFLYFRHNTHPRFIHTPVASWPLAWSFVALYWNGAIAAHATGLAARILANVAVWGILVYGLFFLVIYKDYTIGLALSILTASIAVQQLAIKVIAFQWIFAFVILGVLLFATLVIGAPVIARDFGFRKDSPVVADQERAPLLDDQ